MTTLHMTYMGSCSIGGSNILCTNMSSSLEQKAQFSDHVLGLRDVLNGITKGDGGGGGTVNVQKKVYRYSPAIGKASIQAPVADGSAFGDILEKAISGEEIETEMIFWKTGAPRVSIKKAIISSFSLSIKAGEVTTFSCEITGAEYETGTGGSTDIACTKLVTWDQCTVSGSGASAISSLDLTINNPPVPIYTAKWSTDSISSGLMPQKIRVGIQEVSGTISSFDSGNITGVGTLKFGVNGVEKEVKVVFVSPSSQGNGGLYIDSISFVGADDGVIWS